MLLSSNAIITIDGAAGTGKSSVAVTLANRLGGQCLDSGAMYRAVAVLAKEQGIAPESSDILAARVRDIGIHFNWEKSPPTVMLGDEDVSVRIREWDISGIVSSVAKQPAIRSVLMEQQRLIAEKHPLLITEGRDQGSVVFPEALVRFFLKADIAERIKRRAKQLSEAGNTIDEKEVELDISNRDHIDSTRSDGPLICPENAIVVDTSNQTLDEVVDFMEEKVRSVLNFHD